MVQCSGFQLTDSLLTGRVIKDFHLRNKSVLLSPNRREARTPEELNLTIMRHFQVRTNKQEAKTAAKCTWLNLSRLTNPKTLIFAGTTVTK